MGLNFKYEALEKATDYFNPDMKIGEGSAGCVFKGKLPSGETVAIKRLFFSSRQWVDEFFNEVNLVKGMNHKNLVKLLGCSIEGPESLLVYEYLPNRSLDHSLFGLEALHGEKDSYGVQEIQKVVQIGLLCTQASVTSRPSMAEVVEMLSIVGDGEIPEPNQPPFMNSSGINSLDFRTSTSSVEASSSFLTIY